LTLKSDPTPKWLDMKINHYIKAGDNTTAWKFLKTYAPITPDFDVSKAIMRIQKAENKPAKPDKKEKTLKEEVKGEDKK
jgi:hypothetical protein